MSTILFFCPRVIIFAHLLANFKGIMRGVADKARGSDRIGDIEDFVLLQILYQLSMI